MTHHHPGNRPASAACRAARTGRRGYVLVAVLWTVVAVAACALMTAVAGREAVAAAANRVALARAAWRAEDCVARALAATDAALSATATPLPALPLGESPDVTMRRALEDVPALPSGCRLTATPVDTGAQAGAAPEAGARGPNVAVRGSAHPLQFGPPPTADLWTVTARATEGMPPVVAVLELRVARAGLRLAVVRRRTWVE